jgi:hypothetical protein
MLTINQPKRFVLFRYFALSGQSGTGTISFPNRVSYFIEKGIKVLTCLYSLKSSDLWNQNECRKRKEYGSFVLELSF